MTRGIVFVLLGLICLSHLSCQLLSVPSSCGAIPNEQQMKWQEMEYYAFIHFSINTYTDQEWGDGGNKPALFRDIPKIIKLKATTSLRISCLFCIFKHSPQKTV